MYDSIAFQLLLGCVQVSSTPTQACNSDFIKQNLWIVKQLAKIEEPSEPNTIDFEQIQQIIDTRKMSTTVMVNDTLVPVLLNVLGSTNCN